MSQLKNLIESIKKEKLEMQKKAKAMLFQELKFFFEKHKMASSIQWTQYTPYFNDGDACEFSVNEPELNLNEELVSEDVKEYAKNHNYSYELSNVLFEIEHRSTKRSQNFSRELTEEENSLIKDFDELSKSIQSLDDMLKDVFGDHVIVTVTKDGIETEEYDHE